MIRLLEYLDIAKLPASSLPGYAHALHCCAIHASLSGDMAHLCERKLKEIDSRLGKGCGQLAEACDLSADLTRLSVSDLISLHAAGRKCSELRRKKKMEPFTRVHQWRIVRELISRDRQDPLARLLLLAENLEADAHARHLGMPYRLGDRPEPFSPEAYPDDAALIDHIKTLSRRRTYISRETLIEIADHIQLNIVDAGTTAQHLSLVSAILSTGMPSFCYSAMVKALEKATATLAKTGKAPRMQLAPAYHTLWTLTLKPAYLNRFRTTVRHCYNTLVSGKTYPDLGIDPADPTSLSTALRFLDDHRQTLWILNDRYDLAALRAKCGA